MVRTVFLERLMMTKTMSATTIAHLDLPTTSNTVAVWLKTTHISNPTARVWYRAAVVKIACYTRSTNAAASLSKSNRVSFLRPSQWDLTA